VAVDNLPEGSDWSQEVYFDPNRRSVSRLNRQMRLQSHSGKDFARLFASFASASEALRLRDSHWQLDREVWH
jgi:ATP-dependent DNA ligase